MNEMPPPPNKFQSWLDYAVATMDVRGAYLDRIFTEDKIPSNDSIRTAALDALNRLKRKSVMPWFNLLENWKTELSTRLGRSAEDFVEGNLSSTDFSNDSVHIQFNDGSDLTFHRAFYLGDTPADGAVHRVAVFSENCGYHEFWIGPGDQIEVIGPKPGSDQDLQWRNQIRQAQAEVAQGMVVPYKLGPVSEEDFAWNSMAPVGREFGSPDYDRLMAEDAAKFASELALWIQHCSESSVELQLTEREKSDARNVQLALRELGQEVTVEVAASVWKDYSQSVMACWLTGAETAESAARILYLNCPNGPVRIDLKAMINEGRS
jgi:hypothetical protein